MLQKKPEGYILNRYQIIILLQFYINIEYLMIFEKIGITGKQLKALIGGIIIKFSTAVITCWGNINLYFLSTFHYQGTKVTPQTNSIILLFSVPTMVIAMLIANRICQKYGFQLSIRIACFLFLVSPLTNILNFNIYFFTFFSILVPGSMYSFISVPVLNCIWTQFPDSKNRSTSILVIAFGIGSIVWNFLFMHMINPNNEDTVEMETQHGQMSLFSQQVTKNVRKTTILGFAVTGILAFIGSILLERESKADESLKQQKQNQGQVQAENQQQGGLQMEVQPETESTLQKYKSKEKHLTYKQAIKDERFIIIMTISVLTGLYQIYLMMNFKIIYMPIVGDDHFLSYASMICSIVSIAGAFLWGCLGDIKGVHFTILVLSILDFGGKIFSDFAQEKPAIVVMVVLIGLISKSMMTIAGPGFVQIFGLKLGTELLPLKGVAIILGYILVPLFQIATAKYLSPHKYLICISAFSLITLICAIRLYMIKWKQNGVEQIQKSVDCIQKSESHQKNITKVGNNQIVGKQLNSL